MVRSKIGLRPRDAEGLLEGGRKLVDGLVDFRWLVVQGDRHALHHFGFVTDEFVGGDDE